jgi:hypothetical protein
MKDPIVPAANPSSIVPMKSSCAVGMRMEVSVMDRPALCACAVVLMDRVKSTNANEANRDTGILPVLGAMESGIVQHTDVPGIAHGRDARVTLRGARALA